MLEVSREYGLPKHLLPIGDENVTSRLIRQLSPSVDSSLVVVRQGFKELFEQNLDLDRHSVTVVEKPEGESFSHTMQPVLDNTSGKTRLIVLKGDLVFRDEQTEKIASRLFTAQHRLFCEYGLKKPVIRAILTDRNIIEKFIEEDIDPGSTKSLVPFIVKYCGKSFLGGDLGISRIKADANLNTPNNYQKLLGNIRFL